MHNNKCMRLYGNLSKLKLVQLKKSSHDVTLFDRGKGISGSLGLNCILGVLVWMIV